MRCACNRANRKLYERSPGSDYGGVNDVQVTGDEPACARVRVDLARRRCTRGEEAWLSCSG
ncbi:hypothetical protein ES319_D06G184400v1 [Gossypium barbadense]|uniref:Uncharacterized protein n=2 Tax=Gossypium TaxID=3633 RepID=A0A5J5R7C0_GOSBA|nr:hypothetical protein ES319_D06G184400v1 [Gossypium barbadense]TYG65562.1 hypothetical protein ES288_D06G196000v1 [Gossypium darwinii]